MADKAADRRLGDHRPLGHALRRVHHRLLSRRTYSASCRPPAVLSLRKARASVPQLVALALARVRAVRGGLTASPAR